MKLLFVDGGALAFRNFVGPLQTAATEAGELTGLRFSFIRGLRSYVKRVKPEKTWVFWDAITTNVGQSARAFLGGSLSEDATAQIWSGMSDLQDMLGLTAYDQCWAPGFEADHAIGVVARKFAVEGHEVVIASPDKDLWPIFGNRILGWRALKNKPEGELFGPAEVLSTLGVPSRHATFFRCVVGDAESAPALRCVFPNDAVRTSLTSVLKHVPMAHTWDDYAAAFADLAKSTNRDRGKLRQTASDLHDIFFVRGSGRGVRENWDFAALQTVSDIKMVRGQANTPMLSDLFKALEMQSLVPRTPEFTGREELLP